MLILGHRGASRAAPENTPDAFVAADLMGADGVELDVRLAPDGRLVVVHDPLPADPVSVAELPDLAVVLDACGERMLVNVEVKTNDDDAIPVVDETVAELLRRDGVAGRRWLVSSFSWAAIERCRTIAPSIATGYLVMGVGRDLIEQTARAGHVALHPFVDSLTARMVEECHEAGLAVTAWTCNDPDRLVELAALGVDGVCTDVPDVALAALGRSGPAVSPRWGTPT